MKVYCSGFDSLPNMLGQLGHVTASSPATADFEVILAVSDDASVVTMDSIDSPLESNLLNAISETCHLAVTIDRPGANKSERRAVITIPSEFSDDQRAKVELGVLRGLSMSERTIPENPMGPHPLLVDAPPKVPFYRVWWFSYAVMAVLFLIGVIAARAQTINPNVNIKYVGGQLVNPANGILVLCPTCAGGIQYTNGAAQGGSQSGTLMLGLDGANFRALLTSAAGRLQIDCNAGCGGAAAFVDNAAFTAGVSNIANMGAVFNDGLSAVTSGNAAAPRITSSRALHFNPRNASGTEIATASNPFRVDPTGTTTQPVSAASWPLPTGASTSALQTTGNTTLTSIEGRLPAALSGSGGVKISCLDGCGGASAFTDNSAFTAGTSSINNMGAVFNDGLAAVTSGNAAAPRITSSRGLHINLRNNAGTEIGTSGTPIRTDPTGSTTQPISGTVTANAGTGNFATNATQIGGNTINVGSGTIGTGTQRVVLATDQPTVPISAASLPLPTGASQDRTTAAAPSAARLSDGTAFYKATTPSDTQPISASSLPLPTGAATSAKQPALGTAGTPSADVISVQGVSGGTSVNVVCTSGCTPGGSFNDNSAFTFGTTAVNVSGFVVDDTSPNSVTENSAGAPRMSTNRVPYAQLRDAAGNERGANVTAANALKVDGSAVTQPVSAASLPLPTGAATEATLLTMLSETDFNSRINTQGQKAMAASTPVVIASDQSTLITRDLTQAASGNLTAVNQAVTFTLTGQANIAWQLTGTWTADVTFEASNDNALWTNIYAYRAGDNTISATVSNSTNNDIYRTTVSGFGFARARVSAFTSGTVVVTANATGPASTVILNGPLPPGSAAIGSVTATQSTAANFNAQVQGAAASGTTKSGNPVQTGGVFNTTQPTVTNGQAVESQATARGAQIVATGVDAFNVTAAQATAANLNAQVQGAAATDAAVTGNPVLISGRSEDSVDAAPGVRVSAEGDVTPLSMTRDGAARVIFGGTQAWSYHENSSSTLTDTTVHAAPGAGLFNYVCTVVISTGAATAFNAFIEDGTTTTILGPYYLEAVAGRGVALNFMPCKKQTTANTAITITTSAAIAHSIDITGYVAE